VCETLNLSAANKKLPGPLGQEEEGEQKQKLHTQRKKKVNKTVNAKKVNEDGEEWGKKA
jgi:hypothetical protein